MAVQQIENPLPGRARTRQRKRQRMQAHAKACVDRRWQQWMPEGAEWPLIWHQSGTLIQWVAEGCFR